jgi:hypothetical protein
MSPRATPQAAQLGFNSLLDEAEEANTTRALAKELAHLPGTMDEALPFFRVLMERHHAAMLAGDEKEAMALRDEADRLATKLNNYEPGIIAGEDAVGCVLERLTGAEDGTVPLWGQTGAFEIAHGAMRVRINRMESSALPRMFFRGSASPRMRWSGVSRSSARPAIAVSSGCAGACSPA